MSNTVKKYNDFFLEKKFELTNLLQKKDFKSANECLSCMRITLGEFIVEYE